MFWKGLSGSDHRKCSGHLLGTYRWPSGPSACPHVDHYIKQNWSGCPGKWHSYLPLFQQRELGTSCLVCKSDMHMDGVTLWHNPSFLPNCLCPQFSNQPIEAAGFSWSGAQEEQEPPVVPRINTQGISWSGLQISLFVQSHYLRCWVQEGKFSDQAETFPLGSRSHWERSCIMGTSFT